VLVNGNVADIPSMQVKVGSLLAIRESSRNIPMVLESLKNPAKRERLPFVETDEKKLEGRLIAEPQLADLPIPIQENLIVELYSKV